ncbi:hypothetical protein CsatB_027120 [Cannabis sativa]
MKNTSVILLILNNLDCIEIEFYLGHKTQHNAPPPETAQASTSSSQAIETLSAAAGKAGSEFAQAFRIPYWGKLKALLPPDWDLINLVSPEETLARNLDYTLMRLRYLEGEVKKVLAQCGVVIKQRDDAQQEISHLKQEAEKLKKDLEEAEKTNKTQADEFEKKLAEKDAELAGKEAETIKRCNKVGLHTLYRAWMANPNMDRSFLEEKEEETLAFCEKARKEEEEAEAEEDEEGPSKSPTMCWKFILPGS